jgi:imidazole glycerol-phosphate synthase subunit HisH
MSEIIMQKISIIDSGLSNLYNVAQAFEYIGAKINIVSSNDDKIHDHLVLPGVGSYEKGMHSIKKIGLIDKIKKHVEIGKPFLGICLGMQMMFKKSYEFGEYKGLGIIEGDVVKIPSKNDSNDTHKIPHIGWNNNTIQNNNELTKNMGDSFSMYFVHSYMPTSVKNENIISTANYNGINIISIVNYKNSYGCQFHPEKSGEDGLNILRNFIHI